MSLASRVDALASRVGSTIKSLTARVTALEAKPAAFQAGLASSKPAHREGLAYYETDADRIVISDGTTWHEVWRRDLIVGNPTAGSGWTLMAGSTVRKAGRVVDVSLGVTNNGSYNYPADGDFVNKAGVATVPVGFRPPETVRVAIMVGTYAGMGYIDSAGSVAIVNMEGWGTAGTMAAGSQHIFTSTYLID